MYSSLGSKFQYSPEIQCKSMRILQSVLNGKWKILILWYISSFDVRRFGELQRHLGEITQSTLTKQLRELERDGFIERFVYPEIPPKVEYRLTNIGKSFIPILQSMREWSNIHLVSENDD
jgi:Predicted transcriptional regulators